MGAGRDLAVSTIIEKVERTGRVNGLAYGVEFAQHDQTAMETATCRFSRNRRCG